MMALPDPIRVTIHPGTPEEEQGVLLGFYLSQSSAVRPIVIREDGWVDETLGLHLINVRWRFRENRWQDIDAPAEDIEIEELPDT